MLAKRLRRWANISPALGQRVVFADIVLHRVAVIKAFTHSQLSSARDVDHTVQ